MRSDNVSVDEHVLHMWSPFSVSVDEQYPFLKGSNGIIGRGIRRFALVVLPVIQKFFLGVKIEGKENLEGISSGVSICNHIHYLDCTIVACALKKKKVLFPTLPSNFGIPVVRHLIRWLGALPIPERPDVFRGFWNVLLSQLEDGKIVHFFPEGSLHPYEQRLRKMKSGAFCLAYDANVPLIPFVIICREPTGVMEKLRRKPYLTCKILPPVFPDKTKKRREEVKRLRTVCRREMQEEKDVGLKIEMGDITTYSVDAIVNAANTTLLGGGGVDGAIHAAAGPELLQECKTLCGCRTGEAKITKGYRLPARYVIHTPGPIWHGGGEREEELLASCYRSCLELAEGNGCKSVAFPSISTGVYRFPLAKAAQIAVNTIGEFMKKKDMEITMVCFDQKTFEAYQKAEKAASL